MLIRRCFQLPSGNGRLARNRILAPDGETSRLTLEPRSRSALLIRVSQGSRPAMRRAYSLPKRADLCLTELSVVALFLLETGSVTRFWRMGVPGIEPG